ncbi:hypothetical protein D9M68_646840 [compost metagenome]
MAVLDKVRKNYQFVRSKLLQAKGRQNGGDEFYISRSVIDLNELAMELALTPAASLLRCLPRFCAYPTAR